MHGSAIELHWLVILMRRPVILMYQSAIELHRLVILIHRSAIALHRLVILMHGLAIALHRPVILMHRSAFTNRCCSKVKRRLKRFVQHKRRYGKAQIGVVLIIGRV